VDDRLAARRVGRRTIHRGRLIDLHVDTYRFSDGTLHEREIVEHRGAAAVVALDGDDLVLVRQHRAPADGPLLEIPAGTRDPLPDGSVDDPLDTAVRELAEETGLRAGRWRHLFRFWTAPGFATETMDLYLATGLEPVAPGEADRDERLEVVRLPWRDALAMVERGAIADAKSIVGILWLARLAERGEVAAG
jgi:ADP-ribose pyrophosphatase